MIVKTLEAEYSLNGKRISIRGTDPEVIDLTPPAPQSKELVAEAQRIASGKLLVHAFMPGSYELSLADGTHREVSVPEILPALDIAGPWVVQFSPGWGAPAQATFDKLISWTSHPDLGIKYFSGTAVYTTTFDLPRELLKGSQRLYLDLGDVRVMADVRLNGKGSSLLWKAPFRTDVTGLLKAGKNKLEIKVVNLWPNRLIGDEQLPEDSERNPDGTLKRWPQWLLDGKPSPAGRYTFSMWRLWKKGDPLLESGLLGPVRVIGAQRLEFGH